MDKSLPKLTIANRTETRKYGQKLITPSIDQIDQQVSIIINSISDSFNNKEFSDDVLHIHEIGILLKNSFQAENYIIKCNDKVRSISWYMRYWHDGLVNYLKKNTKLEVKFENDSYFITL